MNKDGHTDVASSRRMMHTVIEDARDILNSLPMDQEASLPTWWTNKLAVSSAYINSARDYLLYSQSAPTSTMTPTMTPTMEDNGMVDEGGNLMVGDYQTRHFDICPAAQLLYGQLAENNYMPEKAMESAVLQDQLFLIEKKAIAANSANKATVDKAQHYADMIMELADEMELKEEHDYVIDTHMAKIKEIANMEQDDEADTEEDNMLPPSYMMMQNAS